MQYSIRQHFDFLKEGIKTLRTTGSIARSSATLCRHLAQTIDPARAKVVVELGAGDGVLTHYLLSRVGPDTRVVVFEINEVFVRDLRTKIRDPRVTIVHDGAENMGTHFKNLQIGEVDYFISGIPFSMLPEALALSISHLCRQWLRTDGYFVQYHYNPFLFSLYKRVFGNISIDFVARNVPPAFVVSCRKDGTHEN
jgi:phosphatidylethanolamine/phosphatidyl-N-methylethanolamine N-methyltransferase